jgi:CubicO group peptidase (beta-lactamase class C family)
MSIVQLLKRFVICSGLVILMPTILSCSGADTTDVGITDNVARSGLDPERMKRLDSYFQKQVDQGIISGASAMVLHHGKVAYQQNFGFRDRPKSSAMQRDTIFRIYSMTKPITSVAVMLLWEEGAFQLSDPVHWYLPELKAMKVAELDPESGKYRLVKAERSMTIQDLLRHTSGLNYSIFFGDREHPVNAAYLKAGIGKRDFKNSELPARLAKTPLFYHPGTDWLYGRSTDLLGALIEKVSGQTLGEFFQQRIFKPLNMVDTDFYVPANKLDRLAAGFDPKTASYPVLVGSTAVDLIDVSRKPVYEEGGGGLVSTLDDYANFALMLQSGGRFNEQHLLSPSTVNLMTSNHLGSEIKRGQYYLPGAGFGFGLGVAVRESDGLSSKAGVKGIYHWGGMAGTLFWNDDENDLIGLFMIQDIPRSNLWRSQFQTFVYGALIDDVSNNKIGANK